MKKEAKVRLNNVIKELTTFLENEYSSKFKSLSSKEDRQLFSLAKILTQLKQISENTNEEEKVITFPLRTKIRLL